MKFVPAVAYHFCLNLPETFSQPRTRKFSQLCTHRALDRVLSLGSREISSYSTGICISHCISISRIFSRLCRRQRRETDLDCIQCSTSSSLPPSLPLSRPPPLSRARHSFSLHLVSPSASVCSIKEERPLRGYSRPFCRGS